MPCEQRQKLMESLADAARAQGGALRNCREFDRALDEAEDLRVKKELAQMALGGHEQ